MEKKSDLFVAAKSFLTESEQKRQKDFKFIGDKTGLAPVSIEKDWWITLILRSVYALPYADSIQFKGGTSLSKCWRIINRFSEDIDLAINSDYLGFSGELSKNQVSDKLRRASKTFILEDFEPRLTEFLQELLPEGIKVSVTDNRNEIPTQDPVQIYIEYNSVYGNDFYIQPRITLEITGRSNSFALGKGQVSSIVEDFMAKESPAYLPPLEVTAVTPQRTMIEKVCLLHEDFNKSKGEIRTRRMSRHLYDIHMLCKNGYDSVILKNDTLFTSIVKHRFLFNRIDGVDYNTEAPGTFNIIPPAEVFEKYREDYLNMSKRMFYGENIPTFDDIIKTVSSLNDRLNKMAWRERPEFTPGRKDSIKSNCRTMVDAMKGEGKGPGLSKDS